MCSQPLLSELAGGLGTRQRFCRHHPKWQCGAFWRTVWPNTVETPKVHVRLQQRARPLNVCGLRPTKCSCLRSHLLFWPEADQAACSCFMLVVCFLFLLYFHSCKYYNDHHVLTWQGGYAQAFVRPSGPSKQYWLHLPMASNMGRESHFADEGRPKNEERPPTVEAATKNGRERRQVRVEGAARNLRKEV